MLLTDVRIDADNNGMARHPNPTAVQEASGAFDHDPQRREARAHEPIPSGPLGEPHESLDLFERGIWHELQSQAPPGVLTNADRIMLEMVCRLLARERDPRGAKRSGEDIGVPRSPLKAAERNQIISCLARLGMSPADRTKISVDNPRGPEQPADPFSELAARRRGASNSDVPQ